MLYVFQVDTGTMLTFDMNSAMDTTLALKSRLAEKLTSLQQQQLQQLPPVQVSSLVLLTGSGSALSNSSPIHAYGTGTDVTNPIFLFDKTNIINSAAAAATAAGEQQNNFIIQQQQQQQQQQDQIMVDHEDNNLLLYYSSSNNSSAAAATGPSSSSSTNLNLRIDNLGLCVTSMAPTNQTLAMRSACARRMYEVDKMIHQASCKLFQDQNLQLHGWAAVINNFNESTTAFAKKIHTFKAEFQRQQQMQMQQGGEEEEQGQQAAAGGGGQQQQLTIASSIKALVHDRLEKTVEDLRTTEMLLPMRHTTAATTTSDGSKKKTLLEWILEQDGAIPSIEKLVDNCFRLIDKLDPSVIQGVQADADKVIHTANTHSCKEIIGLDSRVEGMKGLVESSKCLLSKQCDQSTAFVTNESRFADLQDSSVLPDLCLSHQSQMAEMAHNHSELEEIRRKLQRSKEELCANLNRRLKWVIFTQKQINEVSIRANVCQETLKKLHNFDLILRQVFDAPHIYRLCIQELQRRNRFATAFTQYHDRVRVKVLEVTESESRRRSEFLDTHGGHFVVQALFQDLTRPLPSDINIPQQYREDYYQTSNSEDDADDALYDFEADERLAGVVRDLEDRLGQLRVAHEEELARVRDASAKELEDSKVRAAEQVALLREKHRADLDGLKARIRFFSRTSSGGGAAVVGEEAAVVAVAPLGSPTAASSGGVNNWSSFKESLEAALRTEPERVAATLATLGFNRDHPSTTTPEGQQQEEDDFEEVPPPASAAAQALLLSEDDFVDHHHHQQDEEEEEEDILEDEDQMRRVAEEHGALLSSFKQGDRVLLYWSTKFETFVAFTKKEQLHHGGGGHRQRRRRRTSSSSSSTSHHHHHHQVNFVLNPGDLPQTTATTTTDAGRRCYLALVSNREFCVARRRSSTYKVPEGFTFCRLQLQPGSLTPILVTPPTTTTTPTNDNKNNKHT